MKGVVARNTEELAQGINECLKTKGKRYMLRPFNRFDTKCSHWWIVPSTEYPVYRFGKFMVCKDSDEYSQIGLHIEKGVEVLGPRRELMMDSTWTWHAFVEAIRQGDVGRTLQRIHTDMGNEIPIQIEVLVNDLNESLEYELKEGEW